MPMSGPRLNDPSALLDYLVQLASKAGQIVREIYATDFAVELKGPNDPVTLADRRVNELVCNELGQLFPEIPIVAEESDPKTYEQFPKSDLAFFVDPVDGTAEFVAKNGEFVVMIGLAEQGRAKAGVLYAPATGITWAGYVGTGAYIISPNGEKTPLQVSTVSTLSESTFLASRSHRTERLQKALDCLKPAQIKTQGSAGLKGAVIAQGQAEGYIQPGYAGALWDACAPDAIVTAAGGRVSRQDGSPFQYNALPVKNENGLLMTNGRIHDEVVEKLRNNT